MGLNNKGRREELKKLKFIKRLKLFNLKQKTPQDYICYKTTSSPCSCFICKGERYTRKEKHKNKINGE